MKNVDLEQKYFTLQQENSQLHSQNESLRSATNSETCSLLSTSEYAVILDSSEMRTSNGHADVIQRADVSHRADVTQHADVTDDLSEEVRRMSEHVSKLAAEKQEVEKAVRNKEAECANMRQELGKAISLAF